MIDRKMRRFRQQLTDEESVKILETGKVAVLAVDGDDNYPYSIPVNYAYLDGCIYIHSASQGHKVDALRKNPKCSICIVDKDDVVKERFTSYFRSVIAFGKAEFIDDTEEKIFALNLLCSKYCPETDPADEISKFLKAVTIIRIRLEHVTGKEAIELVNERSTKQ